MAQGMKIVWGTCIVASMEMFLDYFWKKDITLLGYSDSNQSIVLPRRLLGHVGIRDFHLSRPSDANMRR